MTTPLRIELAAEPTNLSIQAASLDFNFDVEAKADGTPKLPTFSMVGYTGAVVNLGGFYSPVIVDMAGFKTRSQEIPVLRDHDTSRIVGQTDSVKIAADLRLTGTVMNNTPDALEVVTLGKNGFKWQSSIGASADRREFLEQGKKATVNGREVTGPMVIVRESTLGEISFVAIGADTQTSADVAASNSFGTQKGAISMFEQWLTAKGFDPAALSDGMKATLRVSYEAEEGAKAIAAQAATHAGTTTLTQTSVQANPALAMTFDQILKAQRDEDTRVREITLLGKASIQARPALIDSIERIVRAGIEAGSTVNEVETTLLRLRAESGPAVHSRGSIATEITQSVIEAAICKAGRLDNLEKHFNAQTLEATDRHFRHSIGLKEVLMMGARANGWTGTSAQDIRGMLQSAFDIRGEGFSNINIPGTLSNVMNKFLVDYFNSYESAWRKICKITPVRDFKQISSYSLSGDLTYELVGPTGEIKSGTINETKYTNQAATYGKLLTITRQDITNDDLNALTRIPQRLGRGGALMLNKVIWTAFLGGVGSFWVSGNNNLITGGTTTLTAVGLTTALQTFRKQTDPDGQPLGLTPSVLLVPPELEVTAKQLMNSQFFNTGGSSSTAQVPNMNTWQGAYDIAMSTYLSNTAFTGNSTTAWWLLANPADLPTIELAVLNGREIPIIETAQAEFDTLGIQVRAYHDFGAATQEFRGSVRSAGA